MPSPIQVPAIPDAPGTAPGTTPGTALAERLVVLIKAPAQEDQRQAETIVSGRWL